VDKSGLVTDQLPTRRPGLIFVTPSHQFPLGAVMSQRRRQELLRYAARHDTWIVEDDYDAEIRYDNRQVAALRAMDKADRVIFIGTYPAPLFDITDSVAKVLFAT
jgi:GntR family transcriptional regulator/MocR family aminotransferase